MSITRKTIKAIGISSAIVLSNATLAIAQDFVNSQSVDTKAQKSPVILSAKALPKSIGVSDFSYHPEYLANKTVGVATPLPIAQVDATPPEIETPKVDAPEEIEAPPEIETPTEIGEPAQKPISDAEKLSPDPDNLKLPSQPGEVKVGSEKPITLEQAIELALENNRDVQQARLNVERAEYGVRQAKAAIWPTVGFDTNLTYSNAAFLNSLAEQRFERSVELALENPLNTFTEEQIREQAEDSSSDNFIDTDSSSLSFGANITLNYNIYTGGQRGAQIRLAEKQLEVSNLDLERIIEQIRLDTSTNYYNLQNSDSQVNIEEAAVADAEQTLKDAQLLEKAGLGTRFDALRAEVELANAEQRLTRAMAAQDTARRQLAETLSVGQKVDLKTADAVEKAGEWNSSLEETIVKAYKNRVELDQFLLQRDIADEERKIALANVRPTVGLQATYGLSDDFDAPGDMTDAYSIGANIQWTLFDGGAARAAAKQEETDKEIAEVQFANQKNEVRLQVEQSFFELKANEKNISTAEQAVNVAEESLRLARLRFQAGVGTQTDVIESQTELTTARGNYLAAIIDYNRSYTELRRAVSNLPKKK